MRRALRLALSLLLVAALGVSGWNLWQVLHSPAGSWLSDRAAETIAPAMARSMARHGDDAAVLARLDALLAEEPRNWPAIEAVEGVAAERGLGLPAALADRRAALHAADTGFWVTSQRCLACAWDPKACDFSAVLLCRAPVDLTPAGDIAGLLREGANHLAGRPVDEVDLALSLVGLTAVALVPLTAGSSAAVKAGSGMARTAWRMGALAPGLAQPLRRAAREGVDWARLPAARSADDLTALLRPTALRPALALAEDAGRLASAAGPRGALILLSRADTPAEARRIARAAEALGPRTLGRMEVLGKSRFLRATLRWSNELWALLSGLAAAFAALLGLVASQVGAGVLRRLRRLARAHRPGA